MLNSLSIQFMIGDITNLLKDAVDEDYNQLIEMLSLAKQIKARNEEDNGGWSRV